MKAAVLYGDDDIRYEEFPTPEVKPGTVKVRVMATGICGSDVPRVLAGGAHYYPIVLGHEFSGYVAEVGEGVTSVKPGDHVVGAPLIPCMECEDCKAGLYSLCKHYTFIGSRIQGSFADYLVLPEMNVVKIDENIPYEQGALFEPCTVSLHGLKMANFKAGTTVAVVGGGTIGTFAIQWARILGAKKIVAFGRDKKHLELSGRLGADVLISTLDDDYMERAMAETDGRGYDFVFEAAGTVPTIKLCFNLVANRGTIGLIGTPVGDITFTQREWETINRKQMFVTGSWMSGNAPYPGDEWTFTGECFADGRLKYDPEVFYAKYRMADAQEAFQLYKNRSQVKGRVLLYNED
ncbi:MAG: galactitol-1-phosphate 5-dehydrogenase [Lachnospiraceae bacterium]|nr:galactitol-1-phosphate 5-dehydrogenase [Lachnospiraceae bacterium]